MKRTQQDALKTRYNILDAAMLAFLKSGFARTSIADVAKLAGVTRGAVYWHFRDKPHLFDAMLKRAGPPLAPFAVNPDNRVPDALESLKNQLRARLEDALGDTAANMLYRIVYTRCESAPETAAFGDLIATQNLKAEGQIEQALCHAVREGRIKQSTDTTRAAAFIHAALLGFLYRAIFALPHASCPHNAQEIVDSIFMCITIPSKPL